MVKNKSSDPSSMKLLEETQPSQSGKSIAQAERHSQDKTAGLDPTEETEGPSRKSIHKSRKSATPDENHSRNRSASLDHAEETEHPSKNKRSHSRKSAKGGDQRSKGHSFSLDRTEETEASSKPRSEEKSDQKKKAVDRDKNDEIAGRLKAAASPSVQPKQPGAASSLDDKKHPMDSKRRMYGPTDMVKVFVPVSICMLLVVLCVRNIEDYQKDFFIKAPYFMYSEPDDEPTKKLLKAIINASIFLGVIVFATFLLMCFFYFKCYTCLLVYVLVSTFALFTIIFTLQFRRILQEVNAPVSVITYFFLLYNLVMVEMMAVFWKGPKGVQQDSAKTKHVLLLFGGRRFFLWYSFLPAYHSDSSLASLILLSAMVALNVMLLLPQWTSWVLLIALALWDLCAVLSPCGPLKMLVELAEERGEDIMPALIYTGSVSFSQYGTSAETRLAAAGDNGKESIGSAGSVESTEPSEEERNIRLGLGDFIFYSLLVGTASMNGDWTTTLACYVAILTGLGFTLVLLVIRQQALPALPISIAFGVVAFFVSKFVMSKLVLELNRKLILI